MGQAILIECGKGSGDIFQARLPSVIHEIVTQWTDSWKELTSSTRTELESLKAAANQAGYTSVSDDLAASIQQLDSMGAEIERLLKKRQNGFLTDDEKIRLQELIDTRHAIEVKYNPRTMKNSRPAMSIRSRITPNTFRNMRARVCFQKHKSERKAKEYANLEKNQKGNR